jgi:hypothetical protein
MRGPMTWLDEEDLWLWAELEERELVPPALGVGSGSASGGLADGAGNDRWDRITRWISHRFARRQRSQP